MASMGAKKMFSSFAVCDMVSPLVDYDEFSRRIVALYPAVVLHFHFYVKFLDVFFRNAC